MPRERERERELKENSFDKIGLPIGNVTSQVFSNIYLNELDYFIKHRLKVKHYFRYADDFVVIDRKREYLENLISVIRDFLQSKLDLGLHPQKVEIRKFRQGINWLGYVILPHYLVLRTKTKKRMFKKLASKKEALMAALMNEKSFNQSVQSYLGMLKHCEGHKIAEKIKNHQK